MARQVPEYDRNIKAGYLPDALEEVMDLMLEGMASGLHTAAEEVMEISKSTYVPVEDGILRDSGVVGEPEFSDGKVSVTLGFGGEARAYAVYVHEDPVARHGAEYNAAYPNRPQKGPNQSWKYLEIPLFAHTERINDLIVRAGGRVL